ncbi:MAG: hypothetical protein WAK16_10915 [Candidatus Cybelea sp.]
MLEVTLEAMRVVWLQMSPLLKTFATRIRLEEPCAMMVYHHDY